MIKALTFYFFNANNLVKVYSPAAVQYIIAYVACLKIKSQVTGSNLANDMFHNIFCIMLIEIMT